MDYNVWRCYIVSGRLTIAVGRITHAKLLNNTISLDGPSMTLGSAYTIPNTTITNSMLAGSISLSNIVSGGAFQMILCNSLGVPTYASLSLNNLPSGLVNQFIQSNGSSNNWITMSGDATLSAGVLTIAAGSITNAKLLNSSVTLNGQSMILGSAYNIPNTTITNSMLAGNISLSNLVSGGAFQMILCNGSGVPTYGTFSLNNLPSGLINQFIQSNGSSNSWITMSGDATLLAGVLTVGAGKITNAKFFK